MKNLKDMVNKSDKKMDPKDKEIMMNVIAEIKKLASGMIAEDIGKHPDMQQVTVAAPDKEGLVEGLEKAEDVLEASSEGDMEELEDDMKQSEDMGEEDMDSPQAEEKLREIIRSKQ